MHLFAVKQKHKNEISSCQQTSSLFINASVLLLLRQWMSKWPAMSVTKNHLLWVNHSNFSSLKMTYIDRWKREDTIMLQKLIRINIWVLSLFSNYLASYSLDFVNLRYFHLQVVKKMMVMLYYYRQNVFGSKL